MSIGFLVILVSALIYNEISKNTLRNQIAVLESQVEGHIADPSLHHNITDKFEARYVTRAEYNTQTVSLKEEMSRLHVKMDKVLTAVMQD